MNIGAPRLSAEWIAGLVYTMVVVGLEYYPPFATWWDTRKDKRMLLATAGAVVIALTLVGHYTGLFDLALGPFAFGVIRRAFNVWLAYLGGSWLVWSLLDGAAKQGRRWGLPRKREGATSGSNAS